MSWPLRISGFALLLGLAIQCYVLTCCAQLAADSENIRFVANNELTLLWSSLSAIFSSWSAAHVFVKAHYRGPNAPSQSRNWLPIKVVSSITLWVVYIVGLAALAGATAAMLYRQESYLQAIWSITIHIFPILSAAVTMPFLARSLWCQRITVTQIDTHAPAQIETQSIVTLATAMMPQCPTSPASTSARSDKSEAVTVAETISQPTHCAEKPELSPTTDAQSIEEGLCATPAASASTISTRIRSIVQRALMSLSSVVGHSTLAATTAALSVAISALLFNSALHQCRHIHSSPHDYALLVHTTTRFQDNTVRPVAMSIRCIGNMSPEPVGSLPRKATILIEHAIGYPSLVSRSLRSVLAAQNHRVCTYDRPGYMLSPQGYAPIAPTALEHALASALHNAGERAPFYIVGHHSGSEYAHLLANARPEQVVGMSFIYPTAAALHGLLAGITETAVGASLSEAMASVSLLSEVDDTVSSLNHQRALSALGLPTSSSSTIAGIYGVDHTMVGWAIYSSDLAQAQYFEMSQRAHILKTINSTRPATLSRQKLPVLLFGVSDAEAVQDSFKGAVSSHYSVEISDKVEG
ncbi:hypothetical protein GGI20_002128, partial [Coemansia sp. BCRC 34301]